MNCVWLIFLWKSLSLGIVNWNRSPIKHTPIVINANSPLPFHSGPFDGDFVSKVVAQDKPGLQELSLTAVILWCNQQINYAKIRLPSIIKSILCLRQNTSPLIHFLPAEMKCEFLSQNYYSLTFEQKEKFSKSHRLSQPRKHPAILRYFFM